MAKNREEVSSPEVASAEATPPRSKPAIDVGLTLTALPKTYAAHVSGLVYSVSGRDSAYRDADRQLKLAEAIGLVASHIGRTLGGEGYPASPAQDLRKAVAGAISAAMAIDCDYGASGHSPELYGSYNLDGAMTAVLQFQGSLAPHAVKDCNKGDYVSGLVAQLVRALLAVYSEAEIKFNGREVSNAETAKADFELLMSLPKLGRWAGSLSAPFLTTDIQESDMRDLTGKMVAVFMDASTLLRLFAAVFGYQQRKFCNAVRVMAFDRTCQEPARP